MVPVDFHKGVGVSRSLLPTSSFQALVDGPCFPPTDMWDHTWSVVRALMPTLAVLPRAVRHRRETGMSPLARTFSRTWTILRRLQVWAVRSLCLTPFKCEKHDPKKGDHFPRDMAVLRTRCSACFTPGRAQEMWLRLRTVNYYFFLFGKLEIISAQVIITYS